MQDGGCVTGCIINESIQNFLGFGFGPDIDANSKRDLRYLHSRELGYAIRSSGPLAQVIQDLFYKEGQRRTPEAPAKVCPGFSMFEGQKFDIYISRLACFSQLSP